MQKPLSNQLALFKHSLFMQEILSNQTALFNHDLFMQKTLPNTYLFSKLHFFHAKDPFKPLNFVQISLFHAKKCKKADLRFRRERLGSPVCRVRQAARCGRVDRAHPLVPAFHPDPVNIGNTGSIPVLVECRRFPEYRIHTRPSWIFKLFFLILLLSLHCSFIAYCLS
jgi:hypothetical protein